MLQRRLRGSLFAVLCAAVAIAVVAGIVSVQADAQLYPGDTIHYGFCDTGSGYSLCVGNLGIYAGMVTWTGYNCNGGNWYSIDDANCTTGYGSHTNQGSQAGSSSYVSMQSDGNFVLYDGSGSPHWATNTSGYNTGPFLNMQTDGNLVVYYDGNIPIWSLY